MKNLDFSLRKEFGYFFNFIMLSTVCKKIESSRRKLAHKWYHLIPLWSQMETLFVPKPLGNNNKTSKSLENSKIRFFQVQIFPRPPHRFLNAYTFLISTHRALFDSAIKNIDDIMRKPPNLAKRARKSVKISVRGLAPS